MHLKSFTVSLSSGGFSSGCHFKPLYWTQADVAEGKWCFARLFCHVYCFLRQST